MRANRNEPHLSRRALLGGAGALAMTAALPRPAAALIAGGAALDAAQFGIAPDDSRDQGGAISRALDSAARQGKALFLPPGRYAASGIEFADGAHLTGARERTVLLAAGNSPVVSARGARAATLSQIAIDGRLAAAGDSAGLATFRDCADLRIDDCLFTASHTPLLQLGACSGQVAGNRFAQGLSSAIFANDSHGLIIDANTVEDMGDNGILVWRSKPGEDGTRITGNTVARIGNRSGGDGQWGNGINVYRAGNVIAANNRISDCALSAIRNNSGANCQIAGNNLTRSGETAIFVEFAFSGAVVSGNIVDRAATGISVTNYDSGGRLAAITGNLVRDLYRDPSRKPGEPQAYGIGIAAEADTVVSGNVVENAPWIGLVLGYGPYLRDVAASDNVIRGGDYGIAVSVAEGAGSALVRGNLISGNAKAAIAGFDHDRAVTGDLALAGAKIPAHVTLADNRTN